MRITRANARHVAQLVSLMTVSPLLRRYGMTSRRARAALSDALRARDLLLIARAKAEVVGMAWVVVSRALDRSAYLRLLLVAEGEQSRGVGGKLLREAERRARAAGCRHFVFLVTADNRRARSFYERNGYERVGTLRGFVRRRIDESLYVKSWRAATEPVVRRGFPGSPVRDRRPARSATPPDRRSPGPRGSRR